MNDIVYVGSCSMISTGSSINITSAIVLFTAYFVPNNHQVYLTDFRLQFINITYDHSQEPKQYAVRWDKLMLPNRNM